MDFPHGVSSIDELRDDHVGGSNSGQEEEGDYYGLEQVTSFAKDHAAVKTVKSFFYAPNTGRDDEQNILNLELALIFLKHKVSKEAVIDYRLLWK
jgi:hypothetical protein